MPAQQKHKIQIDLVKAVAENAVYLGNNIVKIDSLLNHQVFPAFMDQVGQQFATLFNNAGVTGINKIVTAEASGIAPSYALARILDVPFLYARKRKPITIANNALVTEVVSRTRGVKTELVISPEFLNSNDRVLLIDDFLGTGVVTMGLVRLIQAGGAQLCGIGSVIEKTFETGREALSELNVPVITLVKIGLDGGKLTFS